MTFKVRPNTGQQNSDVRYSARGFIYAETSKSGKIVGIVSLGSTSRRPSLREVPEGILYYNTDTDALEISDPANDRWIGVSASTGSTLIGLPTDGSFGDGAVSITESDTIADAVDTINEFLIGCCSVTLASHVGTTDGNTNGILVDPPFTLGRVASPNSSGSPYYANSWDNDTNRDLTNSTSLNWGLASGEQVTDLQSGTISVTFLDGAGSSVHLETLVLDGSLNNQTSSPSGYCSVFDLEGVASVVQGEVSVTIPPISVLSSNSGYLKVRIKHSVGSNTYSQEVECFVDSSGDPSIASQSVSLSGVVPKYLSGIKFASISGASRSSLLIQADVDNIWKDAYRADPMLVVSEQFGISNYIVPYNSSSVTKEGVSPPVSPFEHDDNFQYSEEVDITNTAIINPDANGNYSQLSFTVRDPFSSVPGTPIIPLILINTYSSMSTDTLELFLDEDYRLIPNSGTAALSSINSSGRGVLAWDSSQSLAVSGGLQVINGSLIYPQTDFSSYQPTPNPDYSSLPTTLGTEPYIRRFRDSGGASRSNGIFRLDGLTETLRANKNILVEIRVVGPHIPGNGVQGPGNTGTGWLSLNDPYNSGTFKGDDGDGCFVTTGGYSQPLFEFTLGGFSTGFAANKAIEVRITFKNPAAVSEKIIRAEITNWN